MVRRVTRTNRDEHTLQEALAAHPQISESQPESYVNRVVVKPWGYEFLMFENELVAIWFLKINEGHSTSMHCHPNKMTSLSVLSGEALCSSFEDRFSVNGIDGIQIDKGAYHATKALSINGIQLIELETPPDKVDLVRLSDSYGRVKKGYETLAEMEDEELDQYGYFHFDEPKVDGPALLQNVGDVQMGMRFYSSNDVWKKDFHPIGGAIYNICRGSVVSAASDMMFGLGSIVPGEFFLKNRSEICEPVTLLEIRSRS